MSHDSCLFVGTPIPNQALIYVALFVDDFIYFSPNPDIEKHFEQALTSKAKVDFMGQIDYFLGILFDWRWHKDGSISVHLSQEAYANQIVESLGLSDSVSSPTMMPYQSGPPIDTILLVDMYVSKRAPLLTMYQCFLSMLNWLTISIRADLMTVHSLLSITTTTPTQSHLDVIWYISHYIKVTANYGISFSSHANDLKVFSFSHWMTPHLMSQSQWHLQMQTGTLKMHQCQTPRTPTKSLLMKLNPFPATLSFSLAALFFGKVKRKNALVKVHTKPK